VPTFDDEREGRTPAVAPVGERLLNVGASGAAVTVNVTLLDVPPPGVGVKTVTGTERAEARSAAVMAAVSCVALTTVVVRSAPFQRTTEDVTNPLPSP